MKRKVMAEMLSSLIQKWKMIGYKRVFPHVFFFWACCSISFPLFAPLKSVIYVHVISMLFILLSCSKNFFYINIIKHGFSFTFQ